MHWVHALKCHNSWGQTRWKPEPETQPGSPMWVAVIQLPELSLMPPREGTSRICDLRVSLDRHPGTLTWDAWCLNAMPNLSTLAARVLSLDNNLRVSQPLQEEGSRLEQEVMCPGKGSC